LINQYLFYIFDYKTVAKDRTLYLLCICAHFNTQKLWWETDKKV